MYERESEMRERESGRREREKVLDGPDLDFAGVGSVPRLWGLQELQSRLLTRLLAIYTRGSCNSGT